MESLRDKLAKKGWSQKEIDRTITILQKAPEKKSRWVRWLDEAVVWIALLIALVGNFVLSVVLVPVLLIASGGYLYAIVLISGTAFGVIFTLLLRTIEKIELHQHILAGVFIPAIGLINLYIITRLSNKLITILKLPTTEHDPILISMVYILAFLLPYLLIHYFQEFSTNSTTKITA